MTRSVYLQGLFFLKPEEAALKVPKSVPFLKKLSQLSKKYNKSIQEMAIGYVKKFPEISTLVIGAEKPEQIIHNMEIYDKVNLESKLIKEIENNFVDIPEEVTNPSLWKKEQ